MTYKEREQIFSKDALTTSELAKLWGLDIATASQQMQAIKRCIGAENLRFNIKGKLHTQDYLDYCKIKEGNPRYYTIRENDENY